MKDIKVSELEQIERLQWLSCNDFILKPNYTWQHITEKHMVSQHLVEYATTEEWDRLTDSFDYFTNND